MKRRTFRPKALRYLWHGFAKLGETAIFLLLLPLILIGALLSARPGLSSPKTAKVAQGQASRPHP